MADGSISSSPRNLQQNSVPSGIRWLLPSATDLIFVGILTALVFTPLATKLLGDAGIGWHVRTGDQILATHSIPRTDPFSSTMAGRPWFAWEWLYDLGVGVLNRIAGLNGIAWFTAVVIAGVFSWMFRLLVRREMNFIFALLLVLLAMSASTIHFLARPHVLSWLFTLAFFWLLDSTERNYFKGVGRHRKLWALPMLMLIWVNVHGGFVLGFVLIAVFWFGSVWTWFRTKGTGIEDLLHKIAAGRRVRDLTRVGLASLVVSLANPYGWKLHAHIYSYLTDRFLMDHIEEFQSPNFHGLAEKSFLILLILSLAVLVTSGRKLRTSEGLLVLFITYAGLYASRNIPVSSILLAMIVGPWLPDPKPLRNFSLRMSATELSLKAHLWPIIAVLATFLIAANRGWVGSHSLMDAHFDAHRMPVQAVNYLDARDLQGSILTPDYWGGYIIYRFYPRARVVVDDRHDLYGSVFLKSYLRMMHVERGWDEFLRDHPARYVLLPRNSPLATILADNPEWRSVYADDMAIVFVKSSEKLANAQPAGFGTPVAPKGITRGN